MDAIQAHCAVHVAFFAGQKEVQFATFGCGIATDAILGLAAGTHFGFARLDLQWRNQRLHKVELADGADIFAENRSTEETINDEGGDEINDDQPGSQPGAIPQCVDLVSPKKQEKKKDSQPFIA